ncbi:hypothetical protein [Boseongicola sp. H5]|uniref:hypothetical protein n=1 Tax=Rhodobacterales TaxID=204455 RepID=UPI001B2D24FA|nr:hypothetical protein [Boseongicola sp. H5]MBO6604957.1 hypothetical protein [Roseicyclus sp.]MBO6624428.1 hypothetical protein [Roseicyclus sp.]MBO6922652.1 hypothetical protein [Roseicyclus sp.]
MRLVTRIAAIAMAGLLSACAAPDPLEEDLPDMGDFRLAFNIVVADNMQQVPPSRNATPEEWEAVLQAEIDRRFGAYEGDRLYHIAINVDGYALAIPGIPVLLSPKSVLVISANVWDDAAEAKLHEEPNQITVFEGTSPQSIIGSGLTRSREEQMQILARNAARRVQLWMLENPDWFNIDPDVAAADAAEIAAIAEAAEIDPSEAVAEASAAEAVPEDCVPTDTTPCPVPASN